MDQNELPLEPRQLRVPSGASKMISNPMVSLAQTVHPSCSDTNTIMEWTQNVIPHEPHHLRVPSASSKTISKPMVRLAQTMHLSCIDTNTVSKRTETRFAITHVT
jgi:hypothetical protein